MRIRSPLHIATLILAFALPARAATLPAPLPPHIAVHVSVKSPFELLADIDRYAAAVTKGTPAEIPPGVLTMLAHMWHPVLLNSLGLDRETHIILPAFSMPENIEDLFVNLDYLDALFVFSVPDFDDLVSAVEEQGILEKAEDAAGFNAAYTVSFSTNRDWTLVDLGDGRAAFGVDAGSIRNALAGWTPKHGSDAVLTVHSSMANMGGNLSDKALAALREEADGIVRAITGAGLKPEAARGAMTVLDTLLPQFIDEFDSMRDVVLDMSFDKSRLRIDLRGKPGEDTILSEMAGQIARAEQPDAALAERLPAGAAGQSVTAPFADVIPDARTRFGDLTSMVYGGVLPEFREKARAVMDEFMDCNPGRMATGNYVGIGKQYAVALYEAGDPGKAMQSFTDGIALFNDLCVAAMEDPERSGIRFEGGMLTNGETSYGAYRFAFAERDSLPDVFAMALADVRFFIAPVDGGIVSASGQLTDEDFLDCLAKIKSGSDPSSLLTSKRAKDVLAGLPDARAMLGAFDAGFFFDMFASQQMQLQGMEAVADAESIAAFLAERKKNGELIAFGIGEDAGWLIGSALAPAEAINQIARDVDAFGKLYSQRRTAVTGDEEEYEEGYEDSPEEGGDETEDAAEDEPAAA